MPQRRHILPMPVAGQTSLLTGLGHEPTLMLRHLPPRQGGGGSGAPVLYIHGATFASALSVGFRFGDTSWLEQLSGAGFDAWGFDFAGFGGSDRYAEMMLPAERNPPLGRAPVAAQQIARVVHAISERHDGRAVSLIAHSWGCIAAALFATQNPELVERLVLFGPITQRQISGLAEPESIGAWRLLTVQAQYDRFVEDVPKSEPPVLEMQDFDAWAACYLASDPLSSTRDPAAVQVPAGPAADIMAAWQGKLGYDPSRIRAPVLILRGEWDSLTTAADAAWLLDHLRAAPVKHELEIPRGTHLLHLETGRMQLYRASIAFLVDPWRLAA